MGRLVGDAHGAALVEGVDECIEYFPVERRGGRLGAKVPLVAEARQIVGTTGPIESSQ